MVVGPRVRERSGCCLRCAGFLWRAVQRRWRLEKTKEPASKTRSARILAPWSPGWVIGYTASPLCKLSCLIIGDQRCPPPRSTFPIVLRWSLPCCSLAVWLLGRVVSLPPIFVIYAELNRHGISRQRENAEIPTGFLHTGCNF